MKVSAFLCYFGIVLCMRAPFSGWVGGNVQDQMTTIPMAGGYIPSSSLESTFFNIKDDYLMGAQIYFSTTQPAINLDNVKQLQAVECLADQLLIYWESNLAAIDAAEEWTSTYGLTIFVGHEWSCDRTMSSYAVGDIAVVNSLMTVNITQIERNDVVSDWDLQLNHKPLPNQCKSRKCLCDAISDFLLFLKTPWQKNNGAGCLLNLDTNFNTSTKEIDRPLISIINLDQIGVDCIDCHTRGRVHIKTQFNGTGLVVKQYKVEIVGYVMGSMDYNFMIGHYFQTPLATIVSIPLASANVPGIFSFGPTFNVKTGFTLRSINIAKFQFGWDFSFPLDFEISSTRVAMKPLFLNRATKGEVKTHRFNLTTGNAFGMAMQLTPQFNLGLRSFMGIMLNMYVGIDNHLSLSVSQGMFIIFILGIYYNEIQLV